MAKLSTWITSPKWSPVKHLLIDACNDRNLSFKEISYEKGILSNTLYFEVEGGDQDLENFKSSLKKWAVENGYS